MAPAVAADLHFKGEAAPSNSGLLESFGSKVSCFLAENVQILAKPLHSSLDLMLSFTNPINSAASFVEEVIDHQTDLFVSNIDLLLQVLYEIVAAAEQLAKRLSYAITGGFQSYVFSHAPRLLADYEMIVCRVFAPIGSSDRSLKENVPVVAKYELTLASDSTTSSREIVEVPLNKSKPGVKSVEVEESDELSKLIDDTWCLGSPR